MTELAAKFFNVSLSAPVRVSVPEVGADVFIRPFTGADLEAWESELVRRRGKTDSEFDMAGLRATLVKMTICDESGAQIFADATTERINQMPATILESLYRAAKTANKLDATAAEDAEKN